MSGIPFSCSVLFALSLVWNERGKNGEGGESSRMMQQAKMAQQCLLGCDRKKNDIHK